ncbi:MAG: flagellar protein FlaG [Lachnospiraceae bacterium]|nr:flagellar protein FlaG [Lachnospiraceae bacterium]MDD7328038.1 flagellar protein FlaG [Lachnospiraceae bacterium]MDY2760193.1 flagellar protein FlaG [Lachnospiraceae bacterium]
MGISVSSSGYAKQGSYATGAVSQGVNSTEKTDTERTEATENINSAAVQGTPVQTNEALQQASQTLSEFDQKRDEKQNEQIRKAVSEINKKANGTEAIFGIHDKTNRVTIKIVDKETKKVIREYPPEETLDMIAKVWELAGLMVDEKK